MHAKRFPFHIRVFTSPSILRASSIAFLTKEHQNPRLDTCHPDGIVIHFASKICPPHNRFHACT